MIDLTEKLTRRTMLRLGGIAGLTLAGGAGAAALARPARAAALGVWSRSSYVPLVGQEFRAGDAATPLRLIAVRDIDRRQAGSDDAFRLVFRGSRGASVSARGLPTLSHASFGTVPMFVSAVAPSSDGQRFIAVINRSHA